MSATGGHGVSGSGGRGVFLHDTGGWHEPRYMVLRRWIGLGGVRSGPIGCADVPA